VELGGLVLGLVWANDTVVTIAMINADAAIILAFIIVLLELNNVQLKFFKKEPIIPSPQMNFYPSIR